MVMIGFDLIPVIQIRTPRELLGHSAMPERVAQTVPARCFLLKDLSASGSNTMFLPIRL